MPEKKEHGMSEPNGGNGKDGTPPTSVQDQEYELLGYIEVLNFTASPPQVAPFEPATLSWSVQLPTHLDVPVEVGVEGQMSYQTSGTATVSPSATTEYVLTAQTKIISRPLAATATVTVDQSDCLSGPAYTLGTDDITLTIRHAILEGLGSASNFSIGGDGVSVTVNDVDQIVTNVPLVLDVPDWFSASMDINVWIEIVQQGVPPTAAVSVRATYVNVDVSWAWYTNLTGLITAEQDLVGSAMQQVAQAFMTEIAQSQMAATIQTQLDTSIKNTILAAEADDPEHRTFVLTSFSFDAQEISWMLCPLPPAPSQSPASPPPHTGLPPGQVFQPPGQEMA
jgi:hypothetical protein